MSAKLRHVAITVPDPEKAARFYIEAFGLKRVGETDWENAKGVYLSDGVINLALKRLEDEVATSWRARRSSSSPARRRRRAGTARGRA